MLGFELENLLLATCMFHVVLERAHFNQLPVLLFWVNRDGNLEFSIDNNITQYVHRLQKAILAEFPPDGRKERYNYRQRDYRAK